jgi:hypothetical protein
MIVRQSETGFQAEQMYAISRWKGCKTMWEMGERIEL